MTEYDYIQSNITTLDKVKENSIWLPFLTLAITIVLGLFEVIDLDLTKVLIGIFIGLWIVAYGLRQSVGKKIDRLKNEYQKLK